jgi:acyl-CoA thioesterase FadM
MGVGVTKVGNSSYTLSVGMFNADGDCVAANTSTLANGSEGKSAPISSELRERLEKYRMNLEGVEAL